MAREVELFELDSADKQWVDQMLAAVADALKNDVDKAILEWASEKEQEQGEKSNAN